MEEFLVPYASSSTPKFFVGANSDVTVVHDDNTIVVHRSNKLNSSYDTNNDVFNFPPGFRFCPLDEELIRCYLKKKVLNQALPPNKIHEVNLYKFTPWELSVMFATVGEKEWYFFTPRDRKYKNGLRPNRAAGSGFWKATGADKSIRNKHKVVVGYRKALVFYEGKPPKGVKTNWIMHEYRVEGAPSPKPRGDGGDANDMRLDNWVLCRIYQKYGKSEKKFAPKNQPVPKLAAPPQAVVSPPPPPPPLPPQPTESSVVLYGEMAAAQMSFLSEQDDMDEMQAFYYSPMEYDVIANQPYLPPGLESLLIAENDNGAIQEYME